MTKPLGPLRRPVTTAVVAPLVVPVRAAVGRSGRTPVAALAVAVAMAVGLSACAQPTPFVRVKSPGSSKTNCPATGTCVIEVVMSLEQGKCVYDVPDSVFVPRSVDDLQWVLKPATGDPFFRFPKGQPPIAQKPGDSGPPLRGANLDGAKADYTIKRDAKKTAGVTAYTMNVEFVTRAGGATACNTLDPLVVNMP